MNAWAAGPRSSTRPSGSRSLARQRPARPRARDPRPRQELRRRPCNRRRDALGATGRVDDASWPVGLRQDYLDAQHFGLRGARSRHHHRGREGPARPAAGTPVNCDAVPELRSVPAYDGRGQRGLRPAHARRSPCRGHDPRRRGVAPHPHFRAQRALSHAALGWPAAARGSRPRSGDSAGRAAARRTVRGARPGAARAGADRAAQAAAITRHDDARRHPRSTRGADAL